MLFLAFFCSKLVRIDKKLQIFTYFLKHLFIGLSNAHILGVLNHSSYSHGHLGPFRAKIEKKWNSAPDSQILKNLEVFAFIMLSYPKTFPKWAKLCFYHFLFPSYEVFSKFSCFGHTVHSVPGGGKNPKLKVV